VERTLDGDAIRIAFATVAGISAKEIASIIGGQPYIDLADFYRRSGASTPVIENLILTGAFDSIHSNQRDLLMHFTDLQKSPVAHLPGSQLTFGFAPPALESSGLAPMNSSEKVRNEIKHLGMDVTEHMLSFYAPFLNAIGAVKSSDLLSLRSKSSVLVAGVKVALQTPPVRSGRRVIFLTLDDGYGCSDSTFFPDAQVDHASTLYSTSLLLVRGQTRRTGARGISIRATAVWDLSLAYEKWRAQRDSVAI
jgi:error-prone DNA polymerase